MFPLNTVLERVVSQTFCGLYKQHENQRTGLLNLVKCFARRLILTQRQNTTQKWFSPFCLLRQDMRHKQFYRD